MADVAGAEPVLAKGSPTKELFIEMLTKDIELKRAILDLVDNSVDAARRLKPHDGLDGTHTSSRYKGLSVNITLDDQGFEIVDNCGGIPLSVARDYAFRIGRPRGVDGEPFSVGQFGIGMKRALFKLGDHFSVVSRTKADWFRMAVDVREWRDRETWDFEIASSGGSRDVPSDLQTGVVKGTWIQVTHLHDNVRQEFAWREFATYLREEIQLAHMASMLQGMEITLNGEPLEPRELALLRSDQIAPVSTTKTITLPDGKSVKLGLYAGLSADSKPQEAGWYVFCNDRLVLAADQTEDTGWGTAEGGKIVKYHNQYALFRGYAFFEAEDAGLLPWNTTKTRVDVNSQAMKRARREMVQVMKPIIACLNALDKEKELGDDARVITEACKSALAVPLRQLNSNPGFNYPKLAKLPAAERLTNIQYKRPALEVEQVKQALGATSAAAAGEATFDYFYESVCEE